MPVNSGTSVLHSVSVCVCVRENVCKSAGYRLLASVGEAVSPPNYDFHVIGQIPFHSDKGIRADITHMIR